MVSDSEFRPFTNPNYKISNQIKTGPITLKTYEKRMLWYGTEVKQWADEWPFLSHDPKFPSTADEGAWDLYFRDHLGGFPPSYRLWRDREIKYLNMPEERPELFDKTYDPKPPFRRPG